MKFEVYGEIINKVEGVRKQFIKWKDIVWDIYCNDRFKAGDFESKVHCEICGPEVFNPKVIEYRRHRLCASCLTRFIEMLNAATLADCGRSREEQQALEKNLKRG